MPMINGLERDELIFSSLEATIATDNEVRFIDKLDLQKLGIQSLTPLDEKKDGRVAFSDTLLNSMLISMVFSAAENLIGKLLGI